MITFALAPHIFPPPRNDSQNVNAIFNAKLVCNSCWLRHNDTMK